MRRRPVARVATGVAVATVALSSVFAGTAWAPKITLLPVTKADCRAEGWMALGYTHPKWCFMTVRLTERKAQIEAQLFTLQEKGEL